MPDAPRPAPRRVRATCSRRDRLDHNRSSERPRSVRSHRERPASEPSPVVELLEGAGLITLSGAVTPRSTDWALALLVGLLFGTGVMTLFAGQQSDAWLFAVHGVGGFALAAVLGWKPRRVWRRLAEPARWDRRTAAGAAAVTVVAATLLATCA